MKPERAVRALCAVPSAFLGILMTLGGWICLHSGAGAAWIALGGVSIVAVSVASFPWMSEIARESAFRLWLITCAAGAFGVIGFAANETWRVSLWLPAIWVPVAVCALYVAVAVIGGVRPREVP